MKALSLRRQTTKGGPDCQSRLSCKGLFVDDEESLVEMVPQMLESLGYQVEAKTNLDEAFEQFRSKPDDSDMIILDMTMHQMTGDKLAQKLMEIRPDTPIIISTGFSLKMGIKAVAMKPPCNANFALNRP
jgi:CheY-like chemotaxis protein